MSRLWQVTVQREQPLPDGRLVPGYVQVDDLTGGVNRWSKSPAQLRAEGHDVPDFSRLPQGRYEFETARGWLRMELEAL